ALRLALAFDFQRSGIAIQETTKKGLLEAKRRGQLDENDQFWFCTPKETVKPRDRSSLSASAGVRRAEMIAPSEFEAAVRAALDENLAMGRDDLRRAAGKQLGFARSGKDLSVAIESAIDRLLKAEAEIDHLERVRLRL